MDNSTYSGDDGHNPFDGAPYSKETHDILMLIISTVLSGGFGLFGMITNVVNIILFYRQGPLSNSSTVILTGLAVSDFCVCWFGVLMAVLNMLYSYFYQVTWKWKINAFAAFIAARPLNYVTQTTCWITTFMAFERAFSVVFPFKVKLVFTPKRSLLGVVVICAIIFICHVPDLFEFYSAPVILKPSNLTQVQWFRNPAMTETLFLVYSYLSPVFLRFLSLLLVVISNIVIFWKVNLSQRFRKSKANTISSSTHDSASSQTDKTKTSSPEDGQNSSKEMKLLRMITVISVVFTFCYFMNVIQVILYNLKLEMVVVYHWTEENVVWMTATFFQIFNSSINIIIYYKMSSRFRSDFNACWRRNTQK